MSHARTAIRQAVADALTANGHWTKVYANRAGLDVATENLPAAIVLSGPEERAAGAGEAGNGRVLGSAFEIRILELHIRLLDKGSEVDDALDTASAEVEKALYADTTLGGLVKELELTSTQPEFNEEGDQHIGHFTLTVDVAYRIDPNNPQTTQD